MADNDTTVNNSNQSSVYDDESIPHAVRFWAHLIFLIPSIICSVFVLYHLLRNRTLRLALHNHAIIIFLFIGLVYELTIYPWMLYFLHYKGIWSRSPFFCTLWSFIDWGLYVTQTVLFAWATIERHILIFHNKWVSTQKRRLLVHYLPLLILICYCLIYYIITTFFPPCENKFDDSYAVCAELCIFHTSGLYVYDTLVHQTLPILIIAVFSVSLLLRVRWQKRRVGQSLQWRKHWKMTGQLLFVTIIYLMFAFPLTLLNLLQLLGLSGPVITDLREYFLFLNYCMILLCPFACALSLPQLTDKLRSISPLTHPTRLAVPVTYPVRSTILHQRFVS